VASTGSKAVRRVAALAWLVVALAGSSAHAQGYPNRPVRIVVPFSAGTAADIVARQMGQRLSEMWGQGVVVENQAGAGGNIGAGIVAKAAPDGYTLLMMGINHVINPSLYKEVPYDAVRDFRPIARVAVAPLAIVANPKFPPNTIPELVAYAKAHPNDVLYGSGGNGSVTHLAWELLKSQTGIRMTHVPYKSIAPMVTDILGGQIPVGAPAAASALPYVKAGTLKILAITSLKRSSVFPEVPTVAEAGIAGYDVSAWNGLLAPARTPDAIVDKIYADVVKVAQSKEFVDLLHQQALEVDLLGPAQFRTFVASELDKWSKLVKESGAKLD
jgi:tripartite-type tricarboxylate transporter receptor subunit TctC